MSLPQAQFVVDEKGKKTAVLLTVKQYEKLLEDLHDLAVVAERRDEKPISLKEMRQRLEKDGILHPRS
jgi:PHD/YefM family antitoxin component YafN of YafNO toxin-antitoxin module